MASRFMRAAPTPRSSHYGHVPAPLLYNGRQGRTRAFLATPHSSATRDYSKASTTATFASGSSRAEATQIQSSGRTKDGRVLKPRTYPKFDDLKDERLYRKQHLAGAFRVFADRGFDEGVAGHISVRDPILTDHFCINSIPQPKPTSLICCLHLVIRA
jgi:hypothetical protein